MRTHPDHLPRYEVPRDWNGESVAIIGSGPSLRDFPMDRLSGLKTIVINDAFYRKPDASEFMIGDHRYAATKPDLKRWFGSRIIYCDPHPSVPAHFVNDGRFVYLPKRGSAGLSKDPRKLHGYRTTATLAINYAFLRGSRKIFLVGIDCKAGPKNERHFRGSDTEDFHDRYRRQREGFDRQKWMLNALNVSVYNLNPDSGLTIFPRIKPEDWSRYGL